eukprot:4305704-Lingulodinium_polyedra.AAC.1
MDDVRGALRNDLVESTRCDAWAGVAYRWHGAAWRGIPLREFMIRSLDCAAWHGVARHGWQPLFG